ncbi:hypothetical protein SAMD00019534_018150, partial [Acytostelium subglobosum LB1]|uniref:hypothetical protein n=1 Tax=Acytostelium subglobosum LB1 TaxID=1410327 RepID=UPI0006451DEC
MHLTVLPEELLVTLYHYIDNVKDWYNMALVSKLMNRIGNSEFIWRLYCLNNSITNKEETKSWKDSYIESVSMISLTFDLKFNGFHFASSQTVRLTICRYTPFNNISKELTKHYGICTHTSEMQCEDHCTQWPRYILCRKGMISDRSRSPIDIGLVDGDRIRLSNFYI